MLVFSAVQTQLIVLAALVDLEPAKAFAARTAAGNAFEYDGREYRVYPELGRRRLQQEIILRPGYGRPVDFDGRKAYNSLLDAPDLTLVSGMLCCTLSG